MNVDLGRVFATVVGQDKAVLQLRAAVDRPVHAYLFVGPEGSCKREAARAFAAALLDDERPLHNTHPDVTVVEREGASITVAQAREISRIAARSPLEGSRKILVLTDFHLAEEAGPALLKTIEEASPSTVFVILAESVPSDLVTVASRCVRIDFCSLAADVIEAALVSEGIPAERAATAASAAFGNLLRARLLASDEDVLSRRDLWSSALSRLSGSGAAAAQLAELVVASLDAAVQPLLTRQAAESAVLAQQTEDGTQTTAAVKAMETRHKREQRRLRTDELRYGLATLAQTLGSQYGAVADAHGARLIDGALDAVHWASESLAFNPNEQLLLQGLFVRISAASGLRLLSAG